MKHALHIFLIALCAARCGAGYFEVPQQTVSDYIFTAPILTNNIQGKVIDPAEPYGVIRSEDVDWIHEALAERFSLIGGDLMRRFPGTGARINVDKSWIAPIGWVDSPEAWLDSDAPLLSGGRLATYTVIPDFTNIVNRTTYTNAVTNAFSVITMSITNGTVSVWTNKWSAGIFLPCAETVTNVHEWTPLDLCHGIDGVPFPMYTNTPRLAYGTLGRAFLRIPSAQSISNAYAILQGTKRLADADTWPTNIIYNLSESAAKYTPYSATTNYGLDGVVFTQTSTCYTNGYWDGFGQRTIPFDADIQTRFKSALVTTGGAMRVSANAAYAYGYMFFKRTNRDVTELLTQTNFIVRLASPTLDTSGTQAVVRAHVDIKSICSAVAAMAGITAPPDSGVEFVPDLGFSFQWDISLERFILIYTISPTVKLPSW